MTDEELNRKFDIVAGHLATLAVTQQKAEERMNRADERMDRMDERMSRGEDRLSRAERILLLALRAGRRERREWRERHAALIDAQVRSEDKLVRLEEAQSRTDESLRQLAESQKHSDRRLDALIDIVREERDGRATEEE